MDGFLDSLYMSLSCICVLELKQINSVISPLLSYLKLQRNLKVITNRKLMVGTQDINMKEHTEMQGQVSVTFPSMMSVTLSSFIWSYCHPTSTSLCL